MNKIYISLLLILVSVSAFAQQPESKEKIVTNKWSLAFGSPTLVNHFFSNQEYSNGSMLGIVGEHGAFFRKRENLAWNLKITGLASPKLFAPTNPAKTSSISSYLLSVEYGVSHHWNPVKNLYLRAGGAFNFEGGWFSSPMNINNVLDLHIQPQFKATAGIKYAINFKKMSLNFFGDFGLPFMGLAVVGSKFEGSHNIMSSPTNLNKPAISHFAFTSFHNFKGFNFDLGLDLQFRTFSFILSIEQNSKWWHAYDVQNYMKITLLKLGFSVDLVSRPRAISKNRYF